jgi:hypothetical protein
MVDGLWGEHEWTLYPQLYCREFPYLAWLRLPSKNAASDALMRPIHKRMWQAHPEKSNVHLVDPGVFSEFQDKLVDVKAAVLNPFHVLHANTNSRFLQVQPPKTAYARAFEALDHLEKEFGAWRDFVEVARGLQRSLLELLAFADWWHDIQWVKKLSQCLAVLERLTWHKSSKLHNNLKIIYVILGYLSFQISLNTRDLEQNGWNAR